jgi:alkaline phosphatase
MHGYVDGYVLAVKKNKLNAYRKMAERGRKIWMKHGALDYKECVGEDLKKTEWAVPFTRMMKTKPGETVVFAYIRYKSRAHRDRVNAKVMKDPAMHDPAWTTTSMPFDMKRMAYGGFKIIVG